jgi:hypothetical protein
MPETERYANKAHLSQPRRTSFSGCRTPPPINRFHRDYGFWLLGAFK